MAQVKEFIVYSATKAEFEAQVASGEVDNTQIGIIAETGEFWEKGNYHPLVDLEDYLKKTDAVELAKDLTGPLEATPEEFVFRASAGTKSIRDESAVIRRIKGNTSVWGQIVDINASFTNSGNRYIITRNDDGSVTIKRDPTITSGYWCAYNMNNAYRNTSHKYMFYADVSVSRVAASTDYCGVSVYNLAIMAGNHSNFGSNGRHTFCCFGTPLTSTTYWQFAFYVYGVAELTIHNLQCFDLTAIFDAGNEPTTIEEFKKLYPESYYPYCAPEVRSMRATGIETIGFNAFNGEYAEVLGDMQYCLCGNFTSIGFSDTIGGDITDITIPEDGIYTPSKRGYIYASGTNICIHLVHSGVCNGEYHDYWKSMRTLPDIAKYFPEGMHGIGDVFDEINEENVVKRFGVRAYEDGDNDNADVRTDGTNTVYILEEPIITPIVEPLQLDYKVADFGTEKMLHDLPSSPFRADIVYRFNAEGRIRDNSRNIERLEEHTKNMATMDYVIEKIPTAIATATERVTTWPSDNILVANVLVDVSMKSRETPLSILGFVGGSSDNSFDDVWRIRFAGLSSVLNILPRIYWVNGQAPSFNTWAICDIEFRRSSSPSDFIIGEWKIYR